MYFTLLDLLRFFSAIAVLFHHTFYFKDGKLGVYLFFIISGFVIYFSLRKGMKDYIISRFLRLFPLFWVCCTLTYLVTLFYGVNLPLKNYLISMLLVNDGKIASMVDGSYWTLTFEVLFYAYIAVFVSLFSSKRLEWFYISWLLISFFSFYYGVDQSIVAKLLSVRFAPY
jgi:peptidoglycan/LPS O-acetylase OafA/YrhL